MLNLGSIALLIAKHYEIAQKRKDIRKPWSWAVYQAWVVIDLKEQERKGTDESGVKMDEDGEQE